MGQMGFGAHGHEPGGEERANACRIRWGDLRPERSAGVSMWRAAAARPRPSPAPRRPGSTSIATSHRSATPRPSSRMPHLYARPGRHCGTAAPGPAADGPDHPRIPVRRHRHDRYTAVGRREPARSHVIQHRFQATHTPAGQPCAHLHQERRPARARIAMSWGREPRSPNTRMQASRIWASPGAWRKTASRCANRPSGTNTARRDTRSQRLPRHRTEPILAGRALPVSSSRWILIR